MSGYVAFVKKEFKENTRNFRVFIILAVFVVFGTLSPLSARFMSEIIAAFAPDMQTLTESTALDSWTQFYKNISQVGFSAMIILFGSCLSSEYSKGTLVIMLTKGLSRPSVILSKLTSAITIMTVSYWIGFGITYGYTAYLWQNASLPHTVFAALALWIDGLLYLSILMFGCVLFRQAFTSILFTGGVAASMSLIFMPKQIARYSPFILASKNIDLLSGSAAISEFVMPIIVSFIMIAGLLVASISVFNKKQL